MGEDGRLARGVVVRRLLVVDQGPGSVSSLHVRVMAEAAGVTVRTVWRWLSEAPGPGTGKDSEGSAGPSRGGVRLFVPGARVVSTAGVAAVVEAVGHTVAARGVGCVFGERGVGKTVAVQQALHLLPDRVPVWRAVVGVKPGLPQMRASLLEALGLAAGSLAHRAQPADRALGEALRRPGVLFLDDAQRLSPPLLDYLRLLWDEPGTAAALLLCGAGVERVIARAPALRSRVLTWHQVPGWMGSGSGRRWRCSMTCGKASIRRMWRGRMRRWHGATSVPGRRSPLTSTPCPGEAGTYGWTVR
ncbi:ATP-binding protein [Streptomyces bambusae]|uniref:AAA family ATPase n=1 Tax=Streptomyces bambusae TaxID=1550616 RepID=A0ABS6Z258_9ACTN|nr:ATP-binding protein [Streptomyces bambusae]MBW5481830.1 AAA family ATPase [Streptomyces bambusae]